MTKMIQTPNDIAMLPAFNGMYSIGRFEHVVKSINFAADAYGAEKPVLDYIGTVKLHGTNGGVGYYKDIDAMAALSKEQYLSESQQNNGFWGFVNNRQTTFAAAFEKLKTHYAKEWDAADYIVIFGEYCGGSIQKKVALAKCEKMFVVFGGMFVKKGDTPESNEELLFDEGMVKLLADTPNKVYHAFDFPVYRVSIDFNHPETIVDVLGDLTQQVENNCPVAAAFAQEGIGEGIVWQALNPRYRHPRYWFKSKGEAHKVSKQKTLVTVDQEQLKGMEQFVDYACTDARMEQAVSVLEGKLDRTVSNSDHKDLMVWLTGDILKEESDVKPADFDGKVFGKLVAKKLGQFLHGYLTLNK